MAKTATYATVQAETVNTATSIQIETIVYNTWGYEPTNVDFYEGENTRAASLEGLSVDSASKDAGMKTGTTAWGHYHQTGLHLEIQFIQDSANEKRVHIAVVKQTRYQALNTEPWSSPKIDPEQSQGAAEKLKAGLGF